MINKFVLVIFILCLLGVATLLVMGAILHAILVQLSLATVILAMIYSKLK